MAATEVWLIGTAFRSSRGAAGLRGWSLVPNEPSLAMRRSRILRHVLPPETSRMTEKAEQYQAAFEEGLSLDDIAAAFGVSSNSVAQTLLRHGISTSPATEDVDPAQKARELADRGFSFSQIKRALKVKTPELEVLLAPWYAVVTAKKGRQRARKRRLVKR